LLGSRVYVPFGGLYGDCSDYKGRVVGALIVGSGPLVTFTTPNQRQAGIWAPSGESVRDDSLYVATGNGTPYDQVDDSDSVLRLSPDLTVEDRFTPSNFESLSADDQDLGSTAPALLPAGLANGPGILACTGSGGYPTVRFSGVTDAQFKSDYARYLSVYGCGWALPAAVVAVTVAVRESDRPSGNPARARHEGHTRWSAESVLRARPPVAPTLQTVNLPVRVGAGLAVIGVVSALGGSATFTCRRSRTGCADH